jgi:hypothetical protein
MFQQPDSRRHHEEPEPYVGPSASTWTQDTSIGGENVDSQPAPVALAVSPQGIVQVRDVPTMRAVANSYPFAASADAFRLVGETPQRRAITIIATAAVTLNVDQGLAQSGTGLPIPANTPVAFESAGQIWCKPGAGAGIVGFWAEIDQN